MRDAVAPRNAVLKSIAQALALSFTIDRDRKWKWANNEENQGHLRKAMEMVREKTSEKEYFGSSLSDSPNKFNKQYAQDLVNVQLTAFIAEVAPLNKALENHIETLSSRNGVKSS